MELDTVWNSSWPEAPAQAEAAPLGGDAMRARVRSVPPAPEAATPGLFSRLEECRVLVLRDGRQAMELSMGPALAAVLVLLCVLPMTAGAALRVATGERVQPHALVLAEHLSELGAGTPRAAYLVMPASPPPRVKRPPPVPAVMLPREPETPEARRGHLRVYALHLKEAIDVVPFDEDGRPDAEAFAQISNLWRCRVTGHEVRVHPRLVRILVAINDLYDRPLQLISGHRVPHTIGTSPTSQHTVGNAADVRVSGVSTEELLGLAKKLGGRGVGLYTEQHFVHVDFRPGRRYFWSDRDEGAEDEGRHAAAKPSSPGETQLAVTNATPAGSGRSDG